MAVIDPQLTLLPQIEGNGLMHMAGFFPSVPTQVNFELLYAPVGGRWRLFGLSVSFGQAAPAAPQPLAGSSARSAQGAPGAGASVEVRGPGETVIGMQTVFCDACRSRLMMLPLPA